MYLLHLSQKSTSRALGSATTVRFAPKVFFLHTPSVRAPQLREPSMQHAEEAPAIRPAGTAEGRFASCGPSMQGRCAALKTC